MFGSSRNRLRRWLAMAGASILDVATRRSVVVAATTCAILYAVLLSVQVFQTALPRQSHPHPTASATVAATQGARSSLTLDIRSDSMVQLWTVDASGNEVGLNPTSGLVRLGIAGAAYSGRGVYPQLVSIPNARGTYHVYVKLLSGGSFKVAFDLSSGSASGQAEKVQEGQLAIGDTAELAVAVGSDPDGSPRLDVSMLEPGSAVPARLPGESEGHPPAVVPKGAPTGPLAPESWWSPFPGVVKVPIPSVLTPRIGPASPRIGIPVVISPPKPSLVPSPASPDHPSVNPPSPSPAPSVPSGGPEPQPSSQSSPPATAPAPPASTSPAPQSGPSQPASSAPAQPSPATAPAAAPAASGPSTTSSSSSRPSNSSGAPGPALSANVGPVHAAASVSPTSGVSLKVSL